MMNTKYFVALIKGDEEKILGVFNTREEADRYGKTNVLPHDMGLQYCFCAKAKNNIPVKNNIRIYSYYNVWRFCIY